MQIKLRNNKKQRAQGVLEYVLLVGIVVVALFAMTQAVKRGTQSLIRSGYAQIGAQVNADQTFESKFGYLDSQNSSTSDDNQKRVIDRVGIINYVQDSSSNAISNALTNMGFTEDQ